MEEDSLEPKLKPLVGPQPASASEAHPAKTAPTIRNMLRRRGAGRRQGSETIDKTTSRISNHLMIYGAAVPSAGPKRAKAAQGSSPANVAFYASDSKRFLKLPRRVPLGAERFCSVYETFGLNKERMQISWRIRW
jgi:hypothetical protein